MTHKLDTCDLCGRDLETKPWVMLNRYAMGTGEARVLTEVENDEGEYVWDMGMDDPDDDQRASGTLLCLVPCLLTWLEGKAIETNAT